MKMTNFTENLTFDSNSTSDEISDVLKIQGVRTSFHTEDVNSISGIHV